MRVVLLRRHLTSPWEADVRPAAVLASGKRPRCFFGIVVAIVVIIVGISFAIVFLHSRLHRRCRSRCLPCLFHLFNPHCHHDDGPQ